MVQSKIHNVLSELMGDMSESALAKAINIPKATINRVLSGKTPDPRAGTLIPIAQYFNVTVEQLLGLVPLTDSTPLKTISSDILKIPFISQKDISSYIKGILKPKTYYEVSSFCDIKLDDHCFITKLETTELIPIFSINTNLIIRKSSQEPKNNDIVLYINKKTNDVLFRKYTKVGNVECLISPNPNFDVIAIDQELFMVGNIIEGRISK